MAPELGQLATAAPFHSRKMSSGLGSHDSGIPGHSPPGSPRSASVSLQAAATMNAGLQHEDSRRRCRPGTLSGEPQLCRGPPSDSTPGSSGSSIALHRHSPSAGRRRSTVLMNLHLNDPSIPAPGEMVGDNTAMRTSSPHSLANSPSLVAREPYHARAPSLGELHQELEAEQEGQVNRLLHQISLYQAQIKHLQSQNTAGGSAEDSSAIASSDRSTPVNPAMAPPLPPLAHVPSGVSPAAAGSLPRSPNAHYFPRGPLDRRRSRTPSRTASPRLRSTSISTESVDWNLSRDESTYFQAETQSLTRENQMLKHRIRELERQLAESTAGAPLSHEPSQHSQLSHSTSATPEAAAEGKNEVKTEDKADRPEEKRAEDDKVAEKEAPAS
jgi:hypothetical protein